MKAVVRRFYLALIPAVLGACAPKPTEPSPVAPPPVEQIVMHRSGCFGSCPIYTVTVGSSGKVSFDGENHVAKRGGSEWKISRQDFDFLMESLEHIGFFRLKETYRFEPDGCKQWWTDSPTVDIVVTRGEIKKQVSYYYGCKGIPEAAQLDWLSRTIDVVAKTYDVVGEGEF